MMTILNTAVWYISMKHFKKHFAKPLFWIIARLRFLQGFSIH